MSLSYCKKAAQRTVVSVNNNNAISYLL